MGKSNERWHLIDLVIDTGTQSVTRNGEIVALPPLSFLFLLELVRAAPNILSVDDLMDRVWAGVFVNSETVTQRAKLLRDALGDDPREPRYFAVRRGVGYQLLAVPAPVASDQDDDAPASGGPKHWKAALVAALIVVAGIFATGAYQWHGAQAARQQVLRIAVLPFDNLSADPADAYIAQGIPEMVLNRLSAVPGLVVISRESALLSKAASTSVATAGHALDADFVVKGSVQKRGEMLRVTCFVVETANGARLWSQSFDWPVDRLYALQDRIADQVARSLATRTAAGGVLGPPGATTANSDAYLAFLKGRAMLGRFTVAETEAAAVQFQRAVDLDPSFAAAMVALYDAHMQAASLRSDDLGPVRERYEPLLQKAKAIDPGSGAMLFAEAMWSNRPRDERLALFQQAAEKDPSNSRGLAAYAQFLEWGRRDGEPGALGQQLMDRVMAIDPLSAEAQFWAIQRKVFYSATPAEVEEEQRRALALDPDNVLIANRYATRRWRLGGETAEAIGLMERVIAADPQYARSAHVAFAMYLDVGDLAAARAVAATTPATRESTKAALALYGGDWRSAGEAALGPRGFLFNQFENWLWAEAVRDYALKTGQLDRGAQAIATRYGFDLSDPRVATLGQISAATPLAQILLTQGRQAVAARFLAQSVRWIDEHPKLGLGGGTGRSKAGALMLLGQRDQALSVLLATTRNAHDIRHCWYLTAWDPIWLPVHGDPRFRKVSELCNASIAAQRSALDAARRAGKVPVRGR